MNGEAKSKIKSLPHLPVLRDDFCPQEIADKVIDELVTNYPDNLEQLSWYLPGPGAAMNVELDKVMYKVRSQIREKFNMSGNPMLYVYLACEIWRRMRKAYGYSEEIEVKGVPLAPTPHGPFPELVTREISDELKKSGFTQDLVDQILRKYYEDYPELWYANGEAFRRSIGVYLQVPEKNEYFKKIVPSGSFREINLSDISNLERDAAWRIIEMCQIS